MTNRLADEASPYLRQHADNPVDWWPWGDEAFAEARRRDCPVLISIGYAACHWCHVMAHESFENPETAQIMNEGFVNIKVDREERPDIDAVYMEATQAMTGSGGWPMTVFATPDGEPFYCGTYFPPRATHGRAGFGELCQALAAAWEDQRDKVTAQAAELVGHLRKETFTAAELPTMADLDNAVANLVALHDDRWGGFGGAPKFPQPMAIDVLLGAFGRTGDEVALRAAVVTLRRDGRRRHPGPPRRRVRPVLGRQRVARAPLREDADRPGARDPRLHARVAARGPRPSPRGRRGDRRLPPARPAVARRRIREARGCRRRRRRGQLRRLDPRRDPGRAGRRHRGRRGGDRLVAGHRRGQLRGGVDPAPTRPPDRAVPPARGRARPRRAVRGASSSACVRASTTRC